MSDSFTDLLALRKQETGANENTWGDLLNTDVIDAVDYAIAGRYALATTGGTSTLTQTQNNSAIIDISGVLASNAIVQVLNLSKAWLVRNNATLGAYTVTFKTSGGSASAALPSGWCWVWCNGSNVMYVGLSTALRDTQWLGADGTVAAPGLSFTNQTDTGVRHAGYAAGSLTNPFTTVSSSTTVTVAHTSHGLASGDVAVFASGSAVGGLTLNDEYAVIVVNANSYTITASAAASSSVSGGGGAPSYVYIKAAASGAALAQVALGADVIHVSPYGLRIIGKLLASGAAWLKSTLKVDSAVTLGSTLAVAGASTLTGDTAIGGAGSTAGVHTFSSTERMSLPGGTTAQRPASPAAKDYRINTSLGPAVPEWHDGVIWRQAGSPPIAAGFKNLLIANNSGTPNSQIDLTADAVTVETTSNIAYRLTSVSVTINCGTTGANALDTGALAINTWYSVWVIYNPATNTVAGLASTDATSPTLPSGYTAKARLGWFRTDGSSNLYRVRQSGRIAQYVVGTNPSISRTIVNSATGSGSATSPTLASTSVSGFVPSTASRINIGGQNVWQGAQGAVLLVAPTTSWGGANRGPQGSSGQVWPLYIEMGASAFVALNAWMTLEATTIGIYLSGAQGAVTCFGWEDNI